MATAQLMAAQPRAAQPRAVAETRRCTHPDINYQTHYEYGRPFSTYECRTCGATNESVKQTYLRGERERV